MSTLGDKATTFLKALLRLGGEATTTELRNELGWESYQVRYQFESLEEKGYLLVSTDDEEKYAGSPPKVATLTDQARRDIEDGELGPELQEEDEQSDDEKTVTVSRVQFQELQEEISNLENRVNTLSSSYTELKDNVESLDEEVSAVESANDPSSADESAGDDGGESGGETAVGGGEDVSELMQEIEAVQHKVNSLEATLQQVQTNVSKRATESDVDDRFDEVSDRLSGMESRVGDVHSDVEELDEDVEFLYQWRELAQLYMQATEYLFEVQGINFESAMEDVEEGRHEDVLED